MVALFVAGRYVFVHPLTACHIVLIVHTPDCVASIQHTTIETSTMSLWTAAAGKLSWTIFTHHAKSQTWILSLWTAAAGRLGWTIFTFHFNLLQKHRFRHWRILYAHANEFVFGATRQAAVTNLHQKRAIHLQLGQNSLSVDHQLEEAAAPSTSST